jgi:hypothetical protein
MVRMQPQTPRDGVTVNRARALFFWLLAVGTTIVLYWACLRYLQPGYFSPESVYHIDFYDYAGMRMKSALGLLFNYPRPVAFLAMKLLGYGGLYGTMIGSAALALVNLLLTVLYVRRRFALDSPWMAVTLVLYLLLNIAHPQFYVEHRHDQPAQVSYFFLMVTCSPGPRGSTCVRPRNGASSQTHSSCSSHFFLPSHSPFRRKLISFRLCAWWRRSHCPIRCGGPAIYGSSASCW